MEALPAAGSTETPSPRTRGRLRILAILTAVLVATLAVGGAIGYVIGQNSGADLEAARDVGALRGLDRGKATAGDQYAGGQAKGWQLTYAEPYRKAYKEAYAKAFEDADMKAPEPAKIVVSTP